MDCKITKWYDVVKIKERYTNINHQQLIPQLLLCTQVEQQDHQKGCIITHGNFIGTASSFNNVYPFNETDSLLSFLTLAHSYEEILYFVAVHNNARIAFYSGSLARIIDEVKILHPT